MVEHACCTMEEPKVTLNSVQITVNRRVSADSVPPSGAYTTVVKLSRLLDCTRPVLWNSEAHCSTLSLELLGATTTPTVVRTQGHAPMHIFGQAAATVEEESLLDDLLTPSPRPSSLGFAEMGVSPVSSDPCS